MSTSAFLNSATAPIYAGALIVPTINTGSAAQSVTLSLKGFDGSAVTAWVASQSQAMGALSGATLAADGTVSGTVPGRSFVTFLVSK